MKNQFNYLLTFFVTWFCVAYSFGQKSTNTYEPYTNDTEIEIWIKGAQTGKMRLYVVYGNQNILKDSTQTDIEGKGLFKRVKRYEEGYYYAVCNDNSFIGFLIDANQKFYLHGNKEDFIHTVKTNSSENQLYFDNQVYETELAKKFERINTGLTKAVAGSADYNALIAEQQQLVREKEMLVKSYIEKYPNSFFANFKVMGQNPKLKEPKKLNGTLDTVAQVIMYRNEYWDNFNFNDERMVRTPVYFNKLKTYLTNLFPQRVDSIMKGVKFILEKVDKGNKVLFNFTVNYLLLTYQESTVMGGEKIYCYTVDNYFTYKKAYWADSTTIYKAKFQSDAMKPSLLGEIGQDINCKTINGKYVNLYSIKKPIKIVYLYNPDCEHCQKETPKLKALYDKWKSKGMEVYALNVEQSTDNWSSYITKLNLDWINVNDPKYESNYYKKYHMRQTPGLYVLDINNKIVAKQLMPDQLEPVFELMLSKEE